MSTATDLMGLGMPPMLAIQIAETGAGVAGGFALTAAGNSFATGGTILIDKRLVTVSNGNNTLAVALPRVAGNVEMGDQYNIVNTGTDTVVVWASTGVIISARGTNTSFSLVQPGSTLIVMPTSTSTWGGTHG